MSHTEAHGKQFSDPGRRFPPMEGARNLRDLGGYPTSDGRSVKWGRLFRAGDLHRLTERDQALLAEIPIKTIIDFRRPSETQTAPSRPPASATIVSLPVDAGDHSFLAAPDRQAAARLMEEVYRLLARDHQETFGRVLSLVLEAAPAPLLFHCAAGKDRTGFAAMLILAALGVDRETIMADYLLSNPALGDKYADWVAEYPQLEPLVVVTPSYLEAGFQVIDQEYGGLDRYLTHNLKANLDALRAEYTE